MKIGWKAAGAAAAVAAVSAAAPAQAQTPADIARLDRMALDRAQAFPVTQRMAPSLVRQERIRPLPGLWACSGAQPGVGIRSAPDAASKPYAVTQDHIATSGADQSGFRMVLDYQGRIGFVPAGALGRYRDPTGQGVQCTVDGARQDGAPVFGYR